MKTYMLYLITGILMMVSMNSCTETERKKADIRAFEFDDGGLKVITTSVNEKAGTMSTLYGNESALNYSIRGTGNYAAGELFKLVTFEQQAHGFWYGSKINGALKQVETVKIMEEGIPVYHIEYYGSDEATQVRPDQNARIKFILNHKASVFP